MFSRIAAMVFGRAAGRWLEQRFPWYGRFGDAARRYAFWIWVTIIFVLVGSVVVWSAVAA
jgi:hypothetical protein